MTRKVKALCAEHKDHGIAAAAAALILLALTWLAHGCAQVPLPSMPSAPDASDVVAVVEVACVSGGSAWVQTGSGAAVGPHRVLTAAHVLDCGGHAPQAVLVRPLGQVEGNARVLDPGDPHMADAALLETEAPFRAWAEVAPADPVAGQPVCMRAGDPVPKVSCGLAIPMPLVRIEDELRTGHYAYRAFPVATPEFAVPGNSGSGVFDAAGQLVGIHVGHSQDHTTGIASAPSNWRALLGK